MTPSMLRCFFAVEIPAPQRERLGAVVAVLEQALPQVRFSPQSLHLTLKFLGDLPEASVPRLAYQSAAKLARMEPFDVTLEGFGAFPHARAARVLWIDVRSGGPQLARLARKLDATAGKFGAARDRRPFRPHLTLGRLREPQGVPLDRLEAPEPVTFRVEDVVLFESRLAPSGATHLPLARLPLGQIDDISAFAPDFLGD